MVHEIACQNLKITPELMDLTTNYARGNEAVNANFEKGRVKAKQNDDDEDASPSSWKKDKKHKGG